MIRRPFLVLALAALLSDPARAGFTEAVMAHAQGRYDQALMMLRPLAETAHHPYAQYYLGIMYLNGQGVAPDLKEAARWLTRAAEQGVAQAQYRLGQLYAKGQGVPKDMEIAYAWFGVAAHLGNTQAATEKKTAASALSGDALRNAESLSTNYIDRYGKAPGGRK
ncbi:MAG: tetratricopeptide repeat protein [Gammaproteobacteria bacterium]